MIKHMLKGRLVYQLNNIKIIIICIKLNVFALKNWAQTHKALYHSFHSLQEDWLLLVDLQGLLLVHETGFQE